MEKARHCAFLKIVEVPWFSVWLNQSKAHENELHFSPSSSLSQRFLSRLVLCSISIANGWIIINRIEWFDSSLRNERENEGRSEENVGVKSVYENTFSMMKSGRKNSRANFIVVCIFSHVSSFLPARCVSDNVGYFFAFYDGTTVKSHQALFITGGIW